jgi:hypothetical protein
MYAVKQETFELCRNTLQQSSYVGTLRNNQIMSEHFATINLCRNTLQQSSRNFFFIPAIKSCSWLPNVRLDSSNVICLNKPVGCHCSESDVI